MSSNRTNVAPEEKFYNNLWYVLAKIKERSLYTKHGNDIEYTIVLGSFLGPYWEEEVEILIKLDEWKIIALKNPHGYEDGYYDDDVSKKTFLLQKNEPQFGRLYNLCRNATTKGVSYERIIELIKELVHPIGNDQEKTYEIWELSKNQESENDKKPLSLTSRSLPGIETLYNFSAENRQRIKRFIEILQNQIELQNYKPTALPGDMGKALDIPIETLQRDGYSVHEVDLLIETIDKIADRSFIKRRDPKSHIVASGIMFNLPEKKELEIMLSSLSVLQDIKNHIESLENRLEKSNKDEPGQVIKETSPVSIKGKLPLIEYNPQTGIGQANGKEFKFKDHQPEYRVFKLLYESINKKVLRYDVLVACHFYEDGEDQDPAKKTTETNAINDVAKTIREKTGLDTKQLVMNNGNLTLVGIKVENSPD